MLNVCVFASCSKTLDYADVTSEHRMMRYLYSIEEYLLPNTYYPEGRKLMYFNEPVYDSEGRVVAAYCDFVGIPANHRYEYADDQIVLQKNCIEDSDSVFVFSIIDNHIVSCSVYPDKNMSDSNHSFEFMYDDRNHLTRIDEFSNNLLVNSIIITWKTDNIINITNNMINNGVIDFISSTSYDYVRNDKFKNAFIPIHFQWDLNGLNGIDEVLASQGYFGIITPKDIPVCEVPDFGSPSSYEFELDKKGYIKKINHMNGDDVVREYNFIWR